MADRLNDVNELIRTLRAMTRQETEQTRVNLNRELSEWKARYGKVSSKYAKLRMRNRQLAAELRKHKFAGVPSGLAREIGKAYKASDPVPTLHDSIMSRAGKAGA